MVVNLPDPSVVADFWDSVIDKLSDIIGITRTRVAPLRLVLGERVGRY